MPGPGILPGPVMGVVAFCDGAGTSADGASGGPPI